MACRILLAHNHEVVRIGIRALLGVLKDVTVCGEAADGLEAIERAHQLRPDIVIADLGMPRANGIIVSRRILQSCPSQKLLILGLVESKMVVRELLEAGVCGLISKTDPAMAVVNAVQALRRNRTYFTRFVDALMLEGYLCPGRPSGPRPSSGSLSLRQQEVLQLLAEGQATKEVATTLGISTKTAETHRNTLMRKLRLHNSAQLTLYAVSHYILDVPIFSLLAETEPLPESVPYALVGENARVAGVSA
jgi:DNA-binding NarL/FixJ family response regulator